MSDDSSSEDNGKPKPTFRAEAVDPTKDGAGCGDDCGHEGHGKINYKKADAPAASGPEGAKPVEHVHTGTDCCSTSEANKSGFIERIGEELKTTKGKVIAFGAVAAVALGAYLLISQPEQAHGR